jgi:hypothetical protein
MTHSERTDRDRVEASLIPNGFFTNDIVFWRNLLADSMGNAKNAFQKVLYGDECGFSEAQPFFGLM